MNSICKLCWKPMYIKHLWYPLVADGVEGFLNINPARAQISWILLGVFQYHIIDQQVLGCTATIAFRTSLIHLHEIVAFKVFIKNHQKYRWKPLVQIVGTSDRSCIVIHVVFIFRKQRRSTLGVPVFDINSRIDYSLEDLSHAAMLLLKLISEVNYPYSSKLRFWCISIAKLHHVSKFEHYWISYFLKGIVSPKIISSHLLC